VRNDDSVDNEVNDTVERSDVEVTDGGVDDGDNGVDAINLSEDCLTVVKRTDGDAHAASTVNADGESILPCAVDKAGDIDGEGHGDRHVASSGGHNRLFAEVHDELHRLVREGLIELADDLEGGGVKREGEGLGLGLIGDDTVEHILLVGDVESGVEDKSVDDNLEKRAVGVEGDVVARDGVVGLVGLGVENLSVEGHDDSVVAVARSLGEGVVDDAPAGLGDGSLHGQSGEDHIRGHLDTILDNLRNELLDVALDVTAHAAENEVVEPGEEGTVGLDSDLADLAADVGHGELGLLSIGGINDAKEELAGNVAISERCNSSTGATRKTNGCLVFPIKADLNIKVHDLQRKVIGSGHFHSLKTDIGNVDIGDLVMNVRFLARHLLKSSLASLLQHSGNDLVSEAFHSTSIHCCDDTRRSKRGSANHDEHGKHSKNESDLHPPRNRWKIGSEIVKTNIIDVNESENRD